MVAHRYDIKVRFGELDPYGHLNHSAYIVYFEAGRVELLEAADLALEHLAERGYQFAVTNIETAFLKPVHAGETVTVQTEILEIRRASSLWRQQLSRGDEIVTTQDLRAAVTDTSGRPVRVPEEIIEKLGPFVA